MGKDFVLSFLLVALIAALTAGCIHIGNPVAAKSMSAYSSPLVWQVGLSPGGVGVPPIPEGSKVEKKKYSDKNGDWEDWTIKLPAGEVVSLHCAMTDEDTTSDEGTKWIADSVATCGSFVIGKSEALSGDILWGMTPSQIAKRIEKKLRLHNVGGGLQEAFAAYDIPNRNNQFVIVYVFRDRHLVAVQNYQRATLPDGKLRFDRYFTNPLPGIELQKISW
jgi:hypothetical protein